MVRLRSFVKALAGIDEPLPEPDAARDFDPVPDPGSGMQSKYSPDDAPAPNTPFESTAGRESAGPVEWPVLPAEGPSTPTGASVVDQVVDQVVDPAMGPAVDPAVAPVEAVLRAFGVRRERDLDALTAPPRVIGAALQLLFCVALAAAATAAHEPLGSLMLRLELDSVAAVVPAAIASVVALLTLLAALRLGVRMRNAERRRLYLRFRSRWNGDLDPARAHVSRRGKRSPDPRP